MATAQPHVLSIDPAVYRLTAVKKAAYRFGDRFHIEIEAPAEGPIRVLLTAKSNDAAVSPDGEFRNEVLDQELREQVAEETGRIRDLLMAQAFSGVSLTDGTGETADFRADPLGIAASQANGN